MSKRSRSSSLSVRSKTAMGLPLRITTTGPCSLALRYSAKSAATSVTEATFTAPAPLHRRAGGCLFSRRWPGFALRHTLDQPHRAHENDCLVQTGVPMLPQKALVAAEACDYRLAFLVRKA